MGVQMKRRLNAFNAATLLRNVASTAQQSFKLAIMEFITLDDSRFRCVKDTREFDMLDPNLVAELMEVFLHPRGKKRLRELTILEFNIDQDWSVLSNAQLRRACAERELATSGSREDLISLLLAQ